MVMDFWMYYFIANIKYYVYVYFFQGSSVSSTILPPTVTNSIPQPIDQLNLHPSVPSSIPSGPSTSQLPPVGIPSTQQLPVSSNSMSNIGQQDHQMQNVYQQTFNNHNPISTSMSVQNLSLPQDQSMTAFQHSVSLDETLQNFNLKKLPENLKQILERLVKILEKFKTFLLNWNKASFVVIY